MDWVKIIKLIILYLSILLSCYRIILLSEHSFHMCPEMFHGIVHHKPYEKFPAFNSFLLSSCYLAIALSCQWQVATSYQPLIVGTGCHCYTPPPAPRLCIREMLCTRQYTSEVLCTRQCTREVLCPRRYTREVVYEDNRSNTCVLRCECSKFLPSDTLVRVELNMVISLWHHFAEHTVHTEIIGQNVPFAAISHIRCVKSIVIGRIIRLLYMTGLTQ